MRDGSSVDKVSHHKTSSIVMSGKKRRMGTERLGFRFADKKPPLLMSLLLLCYHVQ